MTICLNAVSCRSLLTSSFLCRTMDEMYRHLSIEVDRHEQVEGEERPKWTVKEGLQKFFQSEQREIKCEKCKEGTTATQTLFVKSRYVYNLLDRLDLQPVL